MKKNFVGAAALVTACFVLIAATGKAQVAPAKYPSNKTVKDYPHTGEPPMPEVHAILDEPLRDVSICKGGDGAYYLTGTLGPQFMTDNEGIKLWRSKDLKNWQPLGLVWGIDRDGTWQKQWTEKNGQKRRALWAPEIHYLKGNYYIAYCITGLGTGLLRSTSGKPEGPYTSVNKPDAPLTKGIDASLFQDDDGTVYFLSGSGMISKMNSDMTALVTKPVQLTCVPDSDIDHHHPSRPCTQLNHVGFEGVFMFKRNGRYYLSCAERYFERYHCMTAEATNIMGPYSARYVSVPYAGHNTFFQDDKGQWISTLFGNDADAPIQKHAGLVPVEFDKDGHIRPKVN
ncbi:glycosyl hydrolase family 43 [Mucilaginibacter yixingensis]|uniref:Glycosyl hydrolase family 43 n=1 Tax=Mucilaginibacter yixingensis TaxID=1295612 RepID=A0A2T5J6W4_9SPHI|nr:family 43 glycosylhydrolase [Mucilaginibacter yixingensis]PTQ94895.1 glycosyl hydrolase family 43 [Mucilaginibacter yixingensis]